MHEQHENTKRKLKIIGFILLGIGAICAIIGFADFFASFNGNGMPTLFWLPFIGLPMCGFGGTLLALGYKREISKYIKNESVPVVNEAAEELTPAVKAIKRALTDEDEAEQGEIICKKCGAKNPAEMRYCGKCGSPLVRICPHCGDIADSDDNFCGKCGKPLE